jgi:hypothetical protein
MPYKNTDLIGKGVRLESFFFWQNYLTLGLDQNHSIISLSLFLASSNRVIIRFISVSP